RIFKLDETSGEFAATEFMSGLGASSVVSMTFGPAESGTVLYYLTYANGGEIRRMEYTGDENRSPTAVASATPTAGPLPLSVAFDASPSQDPDEGDTLTYIWDFGDGTPVLETPDPLVQHTYTVGGTYFAELVVRDDAGALSQAVRLRIDPGNNPPTPTIDVPAEDALFRVGEQIVLQGSATDPDEGPLPDGALSWNVVLVHNDHTHPFLQPTQGNGIPIVAPAPEDLQATENSYLIVTLTATDSQGVESVVQRELRPRLVDVTFDSDPPGVAMEVNGDVVLTPRTLVSWDGYVLDAAAPQLVEQSGQEFAFVQWSDGTLSATRAITTPATPSTYTAVYEVPESVARSFPVAVGGDDGYVYSNSMGGSGAYPPDRPPVVSSTWGEVMVRRSGPLFGGYEVRVGLLRFDTSALPDGATVTSAVLRLHVTGGTSADARSLVAEWYDPSAWPIDAGDYTATAAGTAHAGTPIGSLALGVQNDLPLQNLVEISTTGLTAVRLHVDGGQPTGENKVSFAALENTSQPEAQLIVTYTTADPLPPQNTSPPTISGAAQAGQTLTASPGGWSGTEPITYAYEWQRCDQSGSNCTPIATGQSYTATDGDVGFTLRVSVTATNTAGSATASSDPSGVVEPAPSSLSFTIAVGGDDGYVYSNSMGGSGAYPPDRPPVVSSTWGEVMLRRSGPVFGGYEVRVGLLRFDTSALPDGATVTSAVLRLHVTGGTSADARSLVAEWYDPSAWPIDAGDYTATAAGTAHAGTPIGSLALGVQNDLPLQNLALISTAGLTALRLHVDGGQPTGENKVSFAALENSSLPEAQLIVTYTTDEPLPPENTSPPAISGTAQAGQTLTASPGSWSGTEPISYAYEWSRCDEIGSDCAPIATGQRYTATADDVGSTLRVEVTASNSAGSATASSDPTG
ncbi:MAG TPA: PKD domain-containing protein, partial [Acidimicrobiia bacterium]|nr:PKD domain-containing protein [Acidimicrobiia bacterium]